MEVLESKVKKKESKGAEVKGVALTGNELFEVQQAVQKVLETSNSLKGYYVKTLLANLERLDPVMVPVVSAHAELVKKYKKKDEEGNPLRDQTGFKFENDDDAQKYQAEASKLFEKSHYTVDFVKMSHADFDEMPINTAQNQNIYLVLKYLVE